MKIGILQCDDVQPQLQPEHGNYPAMFKTLFHAIDPTINFAVYRVIDSELPAHIDECDSWLITGSQYSVYDKLEWIPLLEDFIRDLYHNKKKLVGICFGHQLMAQALGGKVEKSDKGWRVGVSENQIIEKREWMTPDKKDIAILVSHQDQVTALPEDTAALAASDFCPFYILQYSSHFLSIQGHPEFTKKYSKDLMISRKDRIPANRIKAGIESLRKAINGELLTKWCLRFLRSDDKKEQ